MIHNLFPIPVGMFNIGRDLSDKETKFIKNQSCCQNQGNTTSEDRNVLAHKEMRSIKKFIDDSLKQYLSDIYSPESEIQLSITQSWLNYTEVGEFHHRHNHPNSFVSAVFYPQADRDHDKITFLKTGYQQIQLPTNNWNHWNSPSWWLATGSGDLMVFPSSLEHMVPETETDQTRISLAVNTFPVGQLGGEERLTSLRIPSVNG